VQRCATSQNRAILTLTTGGALHIYWTASRLSRFLAPNPATRIPSGAAQVCWPRNKNRLVPSVWKSIFAQPPAADRPHFPRHDRRITPLLLGARPGG
jgi:hypothetical protein